MAPKNLVEQAAQLECLLPKLMRRLFTLEPGHPVAELPLAQLRVCTLLQAGPRTLSAISEEAGVSVSAATQIADRLERAGLVERVAEPEDRRMKNLQLTAHGAELMRSRRETRVRRVACALERMTPEQRQGVLSSLHALLEAATATAPKLPREDPVGARLEQ
ncbi:MAG TPA: MarR family transcriptional regulator [Chthonomonadaceae bacterium]|nr:MarR family transcriptional regulator [Chthonomonadaceae bacterium]